MSGIISLLFFSRETGNLGWILLGAGAVLVFLSGGIVLRPTSLWSFFIAFAALAGGFGVDDTGKNQVLGFVEASFSAWCRRINSEGEVPVDDLARDTLAYALYSPDNVAHYVEQQQFPHWISRLDRA